MPYQIRFSAADQKWYAQIKESEKGYATKKEAEAALERIRKHEEEKFEHCYIEASDHP
jgi:hypothetical protein